MVDEAATRRHSSVPPRPKAVSIFEVSTSRRQMPAARAAASGPCPLALPYNMLSSSLHKLGVLIDARPVRR